MRFHAQLLSVTFPQVIFITTLFYLLIYSNEQYLPIQWITDLLPKSGDSSEQKIYTDTFSRVIRYVNALASTFSLLYDARCYC